MTLAAIHRRVCAIQMQALLAAALRESGADASLDPIVVGLGEIAADLVRLQGTLTAAAIAHKAREMLAAVASPDPERAL